MFFLRPSSRCVITPNSKLGKSASMSNPRLGCGVPAPNYKLCKGVDTPNSNSDRDASPPNSILGYGAPVANYSWMQSQADPIPFGFSVWVEPNSF